MKEQLEVGDEILNTNVFFTHTLRVVKVTKTKAIAQYILPGNTLNGTKEFKRKFYNNDSIKPYKEIKWDSNKYKLIRK